MAHFEFIEAPCEHTLDDDGSSSDDDDDGGSPNGDDADVTAELDQANDVDDFDDDDDGGDDDEDEEDLGDFEDEEIEEAERQINGMFQCYERISIDIEECSGGSEDESEIEFALTRDEIAYLQDLEQQMAFLEGDCEESEDNDDCGNDCDEYCADDNMDDLDYSSVE
ncbi:Oidioi.mRNA.OKI2018_I69.chr1.g1219.t1.cds [Oikopleura dioica]|uniref:Oidioi.mRNA.OKI2018_I69.chr1.g1219.t1.cds n=1 Tax=Oikopleura dioica TaxID=34765 RepID=A0ABN7SM91_OIKDI|nr:Oidioi.mRNA.OKI2018_I69.chr1.g1219.t1.cds [Oikopleura dioica]